MGYKSELLARAKKITFGSKESVLRNFLADLVEACVPDDPEESLLAETPSEESPPAGELDPTEPVEVSENLIPKTEDLPLETTAAAGGETTDLLNGQELNHPVVPTVETPEPPAPAAV